MFSNTLTVVLATEFLLIFATTLLLAQPDFLLKNSKRKTVLAWIGVFFLCVTFFWSIILGVVISVNSIQYSF